jgi:hypothetical protein
MTGPVCGTLLQVLHTQGPSVRACEEVTPTAALRLVTLVHMAACVCRSACS